MGSAADAELPPSLEQLLGDAIMEQGRRDPTYISDPDLDQYLTGMGRKLMAGAPEGGTHRITVFGVRDPQINAFTLPGGYIGINSGLVVSAANESELASVLAHEIGHVVQRHIARGMTQQSQNTAVVIASLVGALLAGLAGSGDLAMGVATFGQAAAIDRELGFSRQAEQEADRAGFEMLRKAGYDPRGMVQMFAMLMNSSSLNEGKGGGAYTSTHPLSIQRMSDIQNRVAELPPVHHQDDPQFWYLRAKLRVLQAVSRQDRQDALLQLQQETGQGSAVQRSAAWYGIAYGYWESGDYPRAATALAKSAEDPSVVPETAVLAARLANSEGHADEALRIARAAWQRWPHSQGVALMLVEVLQQARRDDEALKFLEPCIKQWPALAHLYRLRAQSQERLGRKVDARRSMAKYYVLTGSLSTAVEQLRQARDLTTDFYTQSELDAQIRDLRQRLDSERQLLRRFKKSD
ncbi:M48 family metalloprotease [Candidimonas humi]|nr:M48 family metalloprotease [Candidimonas humi]